MRVNATLLLLPLVILAGCAGMTTKTNNSIIASWQGEPITAVVAQWGPALHVYKANDGAMYQWTDSERLVPWKIGVDRERGQEQPGASLIHGTCTRQLNTDAQERVTGGDFHGDNCCIMAVSGYCKSLLNSAKSVVPKTPRS